MKKIMILGLIFFSLFGLAMGQEKNVSYKFSTGFQLNQYQSNFGLGLNIASPFFVQDKVALRLRGNLMFNEYVENNETIWTPYSNLSLGFVGIAGNIGENIYLYGEGGVVAIFPSNNFSSNKYIFGGYGLFGFEFFMDGMNSYFIEIGGVGTGAKADKIENKPIYSNGLLINVGFRLRFK